MNECIIIARCRGSVFLHNFFANPWHKFRINHSSADRALLALIKCAACCSRISNHAQTQTRAHVFFLLRRRRLSQSLREFTFRKNLRFSSVFIAQKLSSRCQTQKSLARHQLCLLFLNAAQECPTAFRPLSRHLPAPQPTNQTPPVI